MSWDIGVEIDTGGEEPARLSDRNVTWNVGHMFELALAIPESGIHTDGCRCTRVSKDGHERGLPALHGSPCVEAAGAIAAALERMRTDPAPYRALAPANGWGTYESAVEDLEWLLAQCEAHPRARIYVH